MPFDDAPNRARRTVRHGDTIWSCVRPNRRSFALVLQPTDDTIASTGFAVLRATDVPWSYLYLVVTTQTFTDYLTNHTTGSAYPAVKADDFEKAELLSPPSTVLDRFARFIEPMLSLSHNSRTPERQPPRPARPSPAQAHLRRNRRQPLGRRPAGGGGVSGAAALMHPSSVLAESARSNTPPAPGRPAQASDRLHAVDKYDTIRSMRHARPVSWIKAARKEFEQFPRTCKATCGTR